jgi:serine/threonine protein kinase
VRPNNAAAPVVPREVPRESDIDYAPTDWIRSAPDSSRGVPDRFRGQPTPETVEEFTQRRRRTPAQIGVGSVIGGRYQITRFVAEGAFGAVYQAQDLDVSGHVVALKLMHRAPASEQERQMHVREVQLIAAISHPSVVSFKDHGLHHDRLYIVMPWYEGETLAARLKRGPLARREALRIFQQLARALGAVHDRGIRHQDVKPENILLARFGEGQEDFPVLLDLGVGAFHHEFVPAFTPAYVAPEMARQHLEVTEGWNGAAVDGKSDVFALALTLFDALAPGARELSSYDSSLGALTRRSREGVALPSREELADVLPALTRWLSVDPAERPSAQELVRELEVLTRAEDRRAERKRVAWRVGPLLSAALIAAIVLGLQLHGERVASRVKDARIEQQAAELDSAREAQEESVTHTRGDASELQRLRRLLMRSEAQRRELLRKLEQQSAAQPPPSS